MARTHKDGRKGGGHHNTQGREYWTHRGYPRFRMMEPGRIAKVLTHRLERRQAKAEVLTQLADLPPVATQEEGERE